MESEATMKLTIDIPATIEQSLHQQLGQNIAQSAREALAVGWYQSQRLSIGQVAEFLGLSIYDAEGLMKRHHVAATYSLEDFEHDRATLERVLNA
jgi:predicted HTH domain antitoxin